MLLITGGAVFIANSMVGQLVRSEREKASLDASLTSRARWRPLGSWPRGGPRGQQPLAIIMEKAGWMRDLLSEEDVKASPNFKEYEDASRRSSSTCAGPRTSPTGFGLRPAHGPASRRRQT